MPLPAATTRSSGGILCEGPPLVLLKHTSRRRSDPWGFHFGALGGGQGVGCFWRWVRGRVTPGGSSRRRGHITGTSMARLEALIGYITTVQSALL